MLSLQKEPESQKIDWVFRPDAQFNTEVARMELPTLKEPLADYRMHRSPFFFKFVRRKGDGESHASFVISLNHLNQFLKSQKSKGPKGGVRVSFESLDGVYLRDTDLIGLIRSGYIGTHRLETEALLGSCLAKTQQSCSCPVTATLPSPEKLHPNGAWVTLPLFERKGWKTLPFGAFAESIGERVEPADAADEIYVGLDDLDSGDLHLKRWGKGSDVTGTKLRFRKGDIIFGRRRAYQRKLAVAEFDGICSAHAMVVRAKPELVLPDFLPFLMMSDKFMKRAVEISVGSLSPTINWKTLNLEEFTLPPLDQQRRIADALWAIDETETKHFNLASEIDVYRESWFASCLEDDRSEAVTIGLLGQIVTGTTPKTSEQSNYEPPERMFVTPADIGASRYVASTERQISEVGLKTGRPIPRDAVMVVCIGSTIGKVAMAADRCLTNQQINGYSRISMGRGGRQL
jgi:hypothetical protein